MGDEKEMESAMTPHVRKYALHSISCSPKLGPILATLVVAFATCPAFAGEVTDKEWNYANKLVVTYFKGSNGIVECTAYNADGKPIGGGYAYASGGVARAPISVPTKYQGKDLKVSCK